MPINTDVANQSQSQSQASVSPTKNDFIITDHAILKKSDIMCVYAEKENNEAIFIGRYPPEKYNIYAELCNGSRVVLAIDLDYAEIPKHIKSIADQMTL